MVRRILAIAAAMAALVGCASWSTLNSDANLPPEARPANGEATDIAEVTPWQKETFGVLAGFAGRTYRGEPLEGSSEAVADIQSWNWAIGGAGLSIRHALEDGSYGGETLVYHDKASDRLAYVYVTSAGFHTEGSFDINEDGSWTAVEEVTGHPSITKVRSNGHQRSDGSLMSASEYYQDDDWVPGTQFLYREVFDIEPVINPPTSSK